MLGLTGGAAAPLVGTILSYAGLGGAVASLVSATGLSGAGMVSLLFGAAGGALSAKKMSAHTDDIKVFEFEQVNSLISGHANGLHVVLGVMGWLGKDTKEVWSKELQEGVQSKGDVVLLEWEPKHLLELGKMLHEIQDTIVRAVVGSVLARYGTRVSTKSGQPLQRERFSRELI